MSGSGHLALAAELEPARARLQAAAHLERASELLDEERQALGAVVQRPHERRRRAVREQDREQLARPGGVERRERQLLEVPAAAQLVAQPAQHVVAREAVGAVGADDEHRQLGQRRGEPAEQRERGLVGPLQVVEHHERGADRLERAPDRLEDRGPVAARRGLAELRQQQREVGAQRAEIVETARAAAQVVAQDGDERAVGSGRAAARRAAEHEDVRGGRGLPGEARLADAGLTGEEQQGAVAFAGAPRARPRAARARPHDRRACCVRPWGGSLSADGRRVGPHDDGVHDRHDLVGLHAGDPACSRIASGLSPS